MKEIFTLYRLFLWAVYVNYKQYYAPRMNKNSQFLEDYVLEVLFSEKALMADLSGYCIDDRFAAQQLQPAQTGKEADIIVGYDSFG